MRGQRNGTAMPGPVGWIEADLTKGECEPTPEGLADIDRGLRAAEAGRFATDERSRQPFAKVRKS